MGNEETLNSVEIGTKSQKKFTHLHLHTSYSLLDGAIRPDELMRHVKSMGMDSVAMTDHGNMFGAIDFFKAARKHEVKPIIGLEFYVSPGSMRETKQLEKVADGNNYHLIVLAQNRRGYENLIKLTSRSYTEGFYRKPRIDYDILEKHSEGLIVSSACLAGEIQRKVLSGRENEAVQLAGRLKEIFGPDRFYLEIMNHGIPEEDLAAKGVVQIARKNNIPLLLTNDSHYLTKEDRAAQDILLRINQKKTVDDELQFGFNDEFYVKSADEMWRLFPELPDAFHNTSRIAEMVDLDFDFGNPLLPHYDVPEGEDLSSHMRKLALEGLKRRYGEPLTNEIMERFEFEYKVITDMEFPGYFLIVQDFINWAREKGVPVGPGRGSAAGSIVAYGLGITDIDPLKYDLLFERFLNPDRKEMPDIDVDFCAHRREEVIGYVREKYGRDRVGQIITYGTMAAKACLKDVARVLKIPFDEANNISKMFPDQLGIGIDEALEKSKDLKSYSESGEIQKKLFAVARKLEGNVRHTGVHAAGVVIAPRDLEELVPMASVAAKNGDKTGERVLVSQYDMNTLTDVGLVKMDFLGLRNLTIIDHALKEIHRRTGRLLNFDELPLDDPKTYELLHRGDVAGVFQLESGGMREFVLKTKPSKFEDIIALIALFRPGPLQSGMSDSFINRKNGKEKVSYPHSNLEPVLQDTYGVIVYQEQVMLISRVIGSFTPGESDKLRKAMGKKKMELVAQMKVKFLDGAESGGYDRRWAEELYDQMAEFAKYGFNKSHSAAYAMIVYRTAYLKANYSTEYMTAVLDSEIDHTEKLVFYIGACREMGIRIEGPDINESRLKFSVTGDGVIRFGLNAIKNVGVSAVNSIIGMREEGGRYTSFEDFVERVDLRLNNKRTLESLIHAGCFDSMGYSRKALIESLDMAINHGQKTQADKNTGQESLFGAMMGQDDSGASFIPRGEDVLEYPDTERLQLEKEVLGFYFTGHPLARFERTLKKINSIPISGLGRLQSGRKIDIAGVITEHSTRLTKTDKEMGRITIEDLSGSVSGVIFPQSYEKIRHRIILDTPVMVKANLEIREETGTVQIMVDDVSELNQELLEEKLEKALHIVLNRRVVNEDSLQKLQTVLSGYQGALAVFFHLVDDKGGKQNKTVIRAHQSFSVTYTKDIIDRLAQMEEVSNVFYNVGNQIRSLVK